MEKRGPSCTVGGNADWCITVESSMALPQKIKNGTSLWPSDSTSGNLSEETWKNNSVKCMHPMFITTLFYNSQDLKAAWYPSVDEWIKKLWYIYATECYSPVKKVYLTFCNSMDGTGEHYAKWNKPVRESTIWFHSYVESNEQNILTNKVETDS